jgi:hypothetical protein
MKKINNMKNKNLLPIIFLSFVVIAVSLFSITSLKDKAYNGNLIDIKDDQKAEVITFYWENVDKPVLVMSASEEISIGAIDLYIGYKNVEINGVSNFGELPEPAFSKVSQDNSLVVLNYLISEDNGFKILPGQSVKVVELDISSQVGEGNELFIDEKTNVVDNETVEGLTYKSENLIINSILE